MISQIDEKIRIRTEEELNLQAQGMKEVRDIFNELEIPYFISGGTLLGIIREGDFIKWDWDIGIDSKIEDIYPKRKKLLLNLKTANFDISNYYNNRTNFKINAVKYGARYEIAGFIKLGDKRYRKAYNYPDSLMSSQTEIILRREKYTTFNKPEVYLEWLYGDWKTPIRTTDKHAYVTSSSRTSGFHEICTKILSLFK